MILFFFRIFIHAFHYISQQFPGLLRILPAKIVILFHLFGVLCPEFPEIRTLDVAVAAGNFTAASLIHADFVLRNKYNIFGFGKLKQLGNAGTGIFFDCFYCSIVSGSIRQTQFDQISFQRSFQFDTGFFSQLGIFLLCFEHRFVELGALCREFFPD